MGVHRAPGDNGGVGTGRMEEGVALPILGASRGSPLVLLHPRVGRGHWGQPCPSPGAPVLRTEPGVAIGAGGGGDPWGAAGDSPACPWQDSRCQTMAAQPVGGQKPFHVVSPVLESLPLSKAAGTKVFMKLENVQPSGSFKIRGIGHLCQDVSAGAACAGAAPALMGGTLGGHIHPLPSFSPAFQAAKKGCRHFVCSSGNPSPSCGDAPEESGDGERLEPCLTLPSRRGKRGSGSSVRGQEAGAAHHRGGAHQQRPHPRAQTAGTGGHGRGLWQGTPKNGAWGVSRGG